MRETHAMIRKELLYEGQKGGSDFAMAAAAQIGGGMAGFQNLCPDLNESFNYFRLLQSEFGVGMAAATTTSS